MPYIDTTPVLSPFKVREGTLQNDFVDLLVQHGWRKEVEFKKAVTSINFVVKPKTLVSDELFTVANHTIVRNARGDLLGVVMVASWTDEASHSGGLYYNTATSTPAEKETFIKYIGAEFDERKDGTVMYFYMLEKLPNVLEGDTLIIPWGINPIPADRSPNLRMALDVEVTSVSVGSTTNPTASLDIVDPTVMQSPIVKSLLRANFIGTSSPPYALSNWWGDSEVSVQGAIDSNNIFLQLQADNSSVWENNLVPTVPIYFGDFIPDDEGDAGVVLFAGTTPDRSNANDVANFDFTDHATLGGSTILPILKQYPQHPSNGIDSIMVSRTRQGSRYQSYFLSWNTSPQTMPPLREDASGNKQYPRAWEGVDKYQFNPSRYSGKVQTSRVYLVHPEEGSRGYLKNAVGLNATNVNTSEIRIKKQDCPDQLYDVYQSTSISSVSPLTKRPSTHYSPMGLGIYKGAMNVKKPYKPNLGDTTPPSDVTGVNVVKLQLTRVVAKWVNPTDLDFKSVDIFVDGNPYAIGVVGTEEYVLDLPTGTSSVKIVSVDHAGNRSIGVTVSVTI